MYLRVHSIMCTMCYIFVPNTRVIHAIKIVCTLYKVLLFTILIRSSDPGVITDDRAQQIIDQALKTSSLNQRNVVAVVTGLMGSGKTWFLSRLFHRPPPDLYTSTGLAEQSFRGLLHHIGAMTGIDSWKLFSNKDILELLAPLFLGGVREANMASVTANLIAMADPPDPATSNPLPLPAPPSMKTSPETASLSLLPFPTKPLSLPQESPTGQAMINIVKSTTGSTSELLLELVHMIDTGGQPELMEVMPSLIHNANLGVLVLNLVYGLDDHPPINFHMKGVAYERRFSSQYTGREIILKLAATFHAKKSCRKAGTVFRLLVVATHRDCVKGDLVARIAALNRELKCLLLPAFKQELILYETPDKIAFVLNLKNPDDTDKKVLKLIRTKVSERGLGEKFRVPGSFYVLEQDLLIFAGENKRYIVSLKECVQVGQRLKLNEEEVQAALVLFHRQNTFLYYRHVLPNHIFIKPQVLLDFVNSIVRFSYQVTEGGLHGVSADLVRSLEDGIITKEIINHDELSSLFVPDLYEPEHAIKLYCHNFTIAPLSHEQQQSKTAKKESRKAAQFECKGEYLMMCLLPAISDQKLSQHIPSSSDTVPLVVRFSKDCVPLSCFSSTISCLLSTYQWKVCRKDNGTPECLAHNIASLYDNNLPVKIILVDVARHVEVYIDSDEEDRDILPQICSQVCQTVFRAIKKVFDVMRLTEIDVSPAVLCPCKVIAEAHSACHFAALNKNYLRCSKTESRAGRADNQHMMWLSVDTKVKVEEKEVSSSEKSPTEQSTTAPGLTGKYIIKICPCMKTFFVISMTFPESNFRKFFGPQYFTHS